MRPAPCVTAFGVLKHAAEQSNGVKGGDKATAIIAEDFAFRLPRSAPPLAAPSFAGRMGYHRIRAMIAPRVPLLVPRINVGKTEIAAVGLDE